MTVERLHFAPGGMVYDSMLAAEHIARYVLAAQVARGRRVLDIACGEGYGSALLADAGAHQVLGIDISPTAIEVARQCFAREGVAFRAGAAEQLPALLDAGLTFDLIVSFETIEHVEDVRRFLEGVRLVLEPGGTVVISAPNEGSGDEPSNNPFHRRTYNLERFRAETEAILGPARAILFGMPLQGFAVVDPASGFADNERTELGVMLESEAIGSGRLLAAQQPHRVDERRASFFVGVWGEDIASALAVAPISESARTETYVALTWLRAEHARLLRRCAEQVDAALHEEGERRLQEVIVGLRRAELLDRQRLEGVAGDLARAQADLAWICEERDRARQAAALVEAQAEERQRASEAALCAQLRCAEAQLRRAEAQLQCAEEHLTAIRSSNSWRVLQLYTHTYDVPVIGSALRLARQATRRVWFLLHPRG